jgi:hypothetical protein
LNMSEERNSSKGNDQKASASLETLQTLKEEMEMKNAILEAMKTAFFNRTPFQGEIPTYEDLSKAAKDFIQTSYKFQKARFGRVRLKFSVSDLLR